MSNLTHLEVDSFIAYRLKPQDLPANPHKLWRAKVISFDTRVGLCWVELLEDGYTGLKEFVYISQIVGVEKPT